MAQKAMDREKGHWILAKMGKEVLRPGGKKLTLKLIDRLDIGSGDHVTEFAPGIGFTAGITLQRDPDSYTGVERNEEAASFLMEDIKGSVNLIVGDARRSLIDDESMDKVYGEAMLSMQAEHRKSEIMREANRILKPGGLYGIHELELRPPTLSDELKKSIRRDLSETVSVHTRPVTAETWKSLLKDAGFDIVSVDRSPMHLLRQKRVIDDEGFLRAVKIYFNMLIHPVALRHIVKMRHIFERHEQNLSAIAIVARKNDIKLNSGYEALRQPWPRFGSVLAAVLE